MFDIRFIPDCWFSATKTGKTPLDASRSEKHTRVPILDSLPELTRLLMSEADPTDGDMTEPTKQVTSLVATMADFDALDFEAPIRGVCTAEAQLYYDRFERAFAAALDCSDNSGKAVFRLLGDICSMVLNPSDSADVWRPLFTRLDGSRGLIPEDIRGEQTEILAIVATRVADIALKARLADIAWSNNRKDGASAARAIEAYCDIVNGLLDRSINTSFGRDATREAEPFLNRALQIASFTTKRDKRPARLLDTFTALHEAARSRQDLATFVRTAELGLDFGIRKPAQIAPELEEMATSTPPGIYPLMVTRAWDFASRLYNNLKDESARQRCLMGAVTQTLAMRTQVTGAAAEASWVMEALQQLRHVTGQEKLEYDLEVDLRRLQKDSLKQMARFEIDLELGDTSEKVTEHFATLSLSDALKTFANLARSRDPEKLRFQALDVAKSSPLMAMMPIAHVDDEGRAETRTSGAPHNGEPSDSWYTHHINQLEKVRRHQIVIGHIDPARLMIQMRFGVASRHFEAIVGLSAFIPPTQKPIIALGFARFFQGDFISATHLLIPQLEPCLRELLRIKEVDPSKRKDDSTEQDLSLNNLYIRHRQQLEDALTPALAWELDRLFNAKPGPALRHEMAHGQISAGACYHPEVYYANWLIYRLCCLFVLPVWDEFVAPQLAEIE